MNPIPRARKAFRPLLDESRLDARQLLSTMAPPLVADVHHLSAASIHAASTTQLVGKHTKGLWPLGNTGKSIAIFAVEFQGAFNATTATAAWIYGIRNAAEKNLSLDSLNAVGDRRTTAQVHELLGWWNLETKRGGWLASDYGGPRSYLRSSGPWWNQKTTVEKHNTVRVLSDSNSTVGRLDDAVTLNWNSSGNTRGFTISFTMTATNSAGDIRPTFRRPF